MTEIPCSDPLHGALDRINSAFDRFQEAHYWIHEMERTYHHGDPFRWSLGAFLKALKEVPQIIRMELQNDPGFKDWYVEQYATLIADPLIAFFAEQRDAVVHRKMIVPNSICSVGITELRGLKLGMQISADPLQSSDAAMERYLCAIKDGVDFLTVLMPDEDSIPCVERVWRFSALPDQEILDLCARAWLKTGELIREVIGWLGADAPELSLQCRHGTQHVRFKLYDRSELIERYERLKES